MQFLVVVYSWSARWFCSLTNRLSCTRKGALHPLASVAKLAANMMRVQRSPLLCTRALTQTTALHSNARRNSRCVRSAPQRLGAALSQRPTNPIPCNISASPLLPSNRRRHTTAALFTSLSSPTPPPLDHQTDTEQQPHPVHTNQHQQRQSGPEEGPMSFAALLPALAALQVSHKRRRSHDTNI